MVVRTGGQGKCVTGGGIVLVSTHSQLIPQLHHRSYPSMVLYVCDVLEEILLWVLMQKRNHISMEGLITCSTKGGTTDGSNQMGEEINESSLHTVDALFEASSNSWHEDRYEDLQPSCIR